MIDDLLPLATDARLTAWADDLIGPAERRQTWIVPLDDERRPLQVVIPLEGLPTDPDPVDVGVLADRLRELVEGVPGAASVVLAWERPGTADVRMQEADWMSGLAAADAPILAQLLISDGGASVVDPTFAAIVAR